MSQNIILNENTHFNVGQYKPDGSFQSYGCFRTNEDAVFMLRWMNGGDTGKTWDTDNEHCGWISAAEYSFYGEERNYPFTIEEENKFKKEEEKRKKEEKEQTDKHREDATLVKEVFWQTRDEWTFGLFSKVFRPIKDPFSMEDYDIPRTEYEMKPSVKWPLILSVCSAIFYLIGM